MERHPTLFSSFHLLQILKIPSMRYGTRRAEEETRERKSERERDFSISSFIAKPMTTNFERKSSEPRHHTFLRSSLLVAEGRERTRLRSNTSKEAVNRRRRSLFRSSSTLYSVTLLLQFFFFAAHGLSSPPKKAEATKRASLSSLPILLVFFPPLPPPPSTSSSRRTLTLYFSPPWWLSMEQTNQAEESPRKTGIGAKVLENLGGILTGP